MLSGVGTDSITKRNSSYRVGFIQNTGLRDSVIIDTKQPLMWDKLCYLMISCLPNICIWKIIEARQIVIRISQFFSLWRSIIVFVVELMRICVWFSCIYKHINFCVILSWRLAAVLPWDRASSRQSRQWKPPKRRSTPTARQVNLILIPRTKITVVFSIFCFIPQFVRFYTLFHWLIDSFFLFFILNSRRFSWWEQFVDLVWVV